ncbi:DMT family transporter [Tenacibaculum geojense]|uniref:DMT family transporter n=1 Tax=Tenacibaculum geojense TaxID=915352 RepID=A0ABW3JTM7_9FLAO
MQYKPVLYMLVSAISFAFMNALVKHLTNFSVYQVVFFRSIGTLVFTSVFIAKNNISFLGNNKKLLIARAFLGVVSITCFFESLKYLPVGTSVSLRYTSPIFAAIFALFLLKEKIKLIQWLLFLLAFLGVLIIKQFGGGLHEIGLLLIIISAITLGFIFVLIRKMGSTENPLVIINYFMLFAFIFGGIMSVSNWQNPTSNELILLLSLGVLGYIGQYYMTKAFQANETNIIAPLKYLEVIVVIIIGAAWFNEIYNVWSLLGVLLIISSLSFNIYVKSKKQK